MEIKFSSLDECKKVLEKALATNGYFVKTETPLAIKTPVRLQFMVEGHDLKIEIRSEVVFAGAGGIGLNFTETKDSMTGKINAFIQNIEGVPVEQSSTDQSGPDVRPQQPQEQQPAPTLPQNQEQAPPQPAVTNVIKGKMVNALKIDSEKKAGEEDILADFGDLSFSKMLLNMNEGKTTGIIRLKSPEIEKVVYVRKGRPVFVESDPPLVDESIGNILLTKGKIKREQLDAAIKYVEEHGVRIGEAMMALKVVSPTLLKDALTYQLKVKLYELFKWPEADFEMQIMPSLGQKFGTRPINVITVVYRGLKEKLKELYPKDLEGFISPIYDKYLKKKEELPFDVENLGFNNAERRFWELMLTGKRRVRQIFEGSTMNKPDTFRFLYALLELNLVDIHDEQTLDIPNIERDLHNQARYMERMNHFQILAVHWSASADKIKASYQNKYEKMMAKKKLPNLSPKALEDIDKMAGMIKKAHDELIDIEKRRHYRKEILGETESKVAAELAARQAQLMEFRGDMSEARELIAIAMDLEPGHHEYRQLFKKYGGKKLT